MNATLIYVASIFAPAIVLVVITYTGVKLLDHAQSARQFKRRIAE